MRILDNEYRIVFSIIISLIILLSLTIAIVHIYRVPIITTSVKPSSSYENLTKQLIFDILKKVEEIRGLDIGEDIEIIFINTSWAIKTWAPKEEVEVPKELLYKELLYKLTFILPYNRTIIQKQREWVGMFAAAVAGNILYINTDYFNPNDPSARNMLSHELTHIAQFLHFNIVSPQTLDSSLATTTLIEGDAGWTQHLYCIKTKLCEPSPPTYINLGDLYLSLNLFPYIYGENFVRYLYEQGGWSLVNKAYSKPPKSTLMIIKPELYIDYLLNDIDITINVTMHIENVENCFYSDVLGAYYIMLIVSKYLGLDKAQDLAMNWRGDRATLCRYSENNRSIWTVLWNTTWSNPSYTINFYNNFTSIIRERGEVTELERGRAIAIIKADEKFKHVIDIKILGCCNVFIRSQFIEDK